MKHDIYPDLSGCEFEDFMDKTKAYEQEVIETYSEFIDGEGVVTKTRALDIAATGHHMGLKQHIEEIVKSTVAEIPF